MQIAETAPIVYSPQQLAFLDWIENGSGSCILEAVAGAGKTTTILGAIERANGQCAILAYNTKIADEIKGKLAKLGIDYTKAQAGTVHSYGFNALRRAFPNMKVNRNKVEELLEAALISGELKAAAAPFVPVIAKLIGLAKQRAVGILCPIDDRDEFEDIIDHFDLLDEIEAGENSDLEKLRRAIVNTAIRFLKANNAKTDEIDFDDMVYLPLILRVKFWRFPFVFVDEAQDTNPARRALVRALVRPGGRVIAVGDRHQAIYGFTGADADSLDLIARDFNAKRMPLTTTYRCPKAVVRFAQKWVSHIEAHETAPEGRVSRIGLEQFKERADLDGNAAVLSRITKPLVSLAFSLIRQRVPCKIEGREIGSGLKKLATRWKSAKTLEKLEAKLDAYQDRETTKWLAKKREEKVQEAEDKVGTLRVIIDRCREEKKDRVADVEAYIDELFSDNVSGILTLSTIHKSKGREWSRVFWLNREGTCPSKWARQQWQQDQEINLQYVAATRAQEELIDIEVPAPPKEGKKG